MKPPQDFLASFRWEVALDIGNHKNQETEQQRDFYNIINEKLDAPTPSC